MVNNCPSLACLFGQGSGRFEGPCDVTLLCSPCLVRATRCALCDMGELACFHSVSGAMVGVVTLDCFVDANVFELAASVILINLDDGNWAGELVGAPEVFNEEVCNRYCFSATRDADAPLPGLQEFLSGGCFVGIEDSSCD